MDLIIEVEEETVAERKVQAQRGEFLIREQPGWFRVAGERYPQKVTLQLKDGQAPHTAGVYRVLPSSVMIDRFGQLRFKRNLDLERSDD